MQYAVQLSKFTLRIANHHAQCVGVRDVSGGKENLTAVGLNGQNSLDLATWIVIRGQMLVPSGSGRQRGPRHQNQARGISLSQMLRDRQADRSQPSGDEVHAPIPERVGLGASVWEGNSLISLLEPSP